MESTSQKIITKIEGILPLLKLSDDGLCVYYHDFLEHMLKQLNKPHDPEKIAENILMIYGGMNTFNDTAIWKNQRVILEAQDKFSELREELFLICEEIIDESRGIKK